MLCSSDDSDITLERTLAVMMSTFDVDRFNSSLQQLIDDVVSQLHICQPVVVDVC